MNYKLIMLPNPILVGRELSKEEAQTTPHFQDFDKRYFEIIANIECIPYLDLSAIAERIGWVDVEKLSIDLGLKYYIGGNYDFENGVRKGILEYQSLNEKKYSEEDVIEFAKYYEGYSRMISEQKWENAKASVKQFLQMWLLKRKPKEYNVECIQEENTIKVTKILS